MKRRSVPTEKARALLPASDDSYGEVDEEAPDEDEKAIKKPRRQQRVGGREGADAAPAALLI